MDVPARLILGILAFFLCFVAQMSRVNINIAIIEMDNKYFSNGWDAKVVILGAFYWCYSLIELPGTFIVRKYGCRKILTINLLVAALGNFLFPTAYKFHPVCAILIRASQGLMLGITWPSMAVLGAKWIPVHERSKYSSTYQGSSVGTSFTNALGGLIIFSLGWESLFYLSGILTILWTAVWLYFGYDTPIAHPRISEKELSYLKSHIEYTQNKKTSVPWKDIFKSKPFWGTFIGSFGIMWFVITIQMQLPPYLQKVHAVDIRTNGLLLAIPDICAYLFSLSYSIFTDRLIKYKIMSVTNARKLACVFSHLVPAFFIIILGLYGYTNLNVAMILAVIAVTSGGATSSGNLANVIDISPNNAGIIMGLCKTMCIFPGILSPFIVNHFLSYDPHNWFPIFLISCLILVISAIFFFICGSGEIQSWNQIKKSEEINDQEENLNLILNKENSVKIVENKNMSNSDV